MLTTVNSLKSPGGKLKISHSRNIVVVGGNSEKLLNLKMKRKCRTNWLFEHCKQSARKDE